MDPSNMPTEIPEVGTPEYDAFMQAVAERGTMSEDDFDTVAKAAADGTGTVTDPVEDKSTDPVDGETTDPVEDKPKEVDTKAQAEEVVTKAGLEWSKLEEEFAANNGQFSEESYAAFEKVGIPRALVDRFIASERAAAEATSAKLVADVFGTVETRDAVLSWADKNLPADEAAAYNEMVEKASPTQQRIALEGLYAKYQRATGTAGRDLTSGAPSNTGPTQSSYKSMAEYQKDVADPRYTRDPAYQQAVVSKLLRSNLSF